MDTQNSNWLEEKFNMLIDAISSNNNTSGLKGSYIKAGEFRKIYNEKFPRHPDYRGFTWNSFIKDKAKAGLIRIYLTHPNGKNHYYILVNQLDQFIKIYPNGVSALKQPEHKTITKTL